MKNDLQGKVVLITGGTEGIGKAAATDFARRGASITILARNEEKAQRVVAEIKLLTGNLDVKYLICDLSSLADVRDAAESFKAGKTRLDILVNNAGAMFAKPYATTDGLEISFAVNHLAHFQLTTSLLDLIKATPGARVVSTSSAMQARGTFDPATTPYRTDVSAPAAYASSKLANILFTKELQRRLQGTTATANCFHPGTVRSQFMEVGKELNWMLRLVFAMATPFAISPEKGADTLVWLATSPEAEGIKGEYLAKRKVVTPSALARDPVLAESLWQQSEQICRKAAGTA